MGGWGRNIGLYSIIGKLHGVLNSNEVKTEILRRQKQAGTQFERLSEDYHWRLRKSTPPPMQRYRLVQKLISHNPESFREINIDDYDLNITESFDELDYIDDVVTPLIYCAHFGTCPLTKGSRKLPVTSSETKGSMSTWRHKTTSKLPCWWPACGATMRSPACWSWLGRKSTNPTPSTTLHWRQ